jgi:arginyl-tRNA synthetase
MIRKAKEQAIDFQLQSISDSTLSLTEQELIYLLGTYKAKIEEAAAQYSPAIIAQYAYDVAKQFNKLYNELSILNEEDAIKRNIRLTLAELTGKTIREAFELLGITSPERM